MSIKGGGFMRLECVDLALQNGIVEIAGKNRQGKSCILNLIQMMKGKEYMPEIPKTKDQRKGKFDIELGDTEGVVRYIVKYSFTDKNSYLSVEDTEGKSLGLNFLKDFLSPCMDPIEFYQNATATGLGAKERRRRALDVVREVMTFDFDLPAFKKKTGLEEDDRINVLYSEASDPVEFFAKCEEYIKANRKEWNDVAKSLQGRVDTLQEQVPITARGLEPVSTATLLAEFQEAQAKANRVENLHNDVKRCHSEVERLKAALESAINALSTSADALQQAISEPAPCLDDVKAQLASVERINDHARKSAELRKLEAELSDTEQAIERRNDILTDIASEREKVLASAKMPVKGLSMDGDSIVKDGIPLGQDSTEEGITDAFMIGLAKFEQMDAANKPKLKTMLISNASLMDKEARDRLYGLATQHGVQLIMELVMDEAKSGVIFVENGIAVNTQEA